MSILRIYIHEANQHTLITTEKIVEREKIKTEST